MKGNAGQSQLGEDGSLFANLPFVVTAAHELKAPLSLVRQLALGLESGIAGDTDEQLRILRQIVLVSERALRLTTDLSRASRLEDSLFDLEPLNPWQICEEVAHELTPLYKARGREIRVVSRYRPLLAVANRDLLRRIILNFGDNALHYADSRVPVELYAGSRGRGRMIHIGVRDYGPALPTDIWQRLQSHVGSGKQPLHNRPQSSGLGLFVAGQFAGAMHGRIGAARHRDGATFYVEIDASTQLNLL
jgi:signal transduction histidine kinase